ncbi:PAS domain-containing sensor histidine kinase [Vibrio sp. 10N.286.49.C2]|uniref:sensor histidine kinase n=1 Tax=unclassified Vibrio TaxID=2614977 RepID=UPI000C84172F|nr:MULTISPECIES: ATP-binding protein [unclassified Vibrio]PMH39698.1 PAS domain-containing sensor histidine kinase [Vibrio sp. 10N.286.49.C2]PMH57683.1 PAS domain-containing sensor histidine kinase [Vibrio sp. 10N.286.49.B1]PMH82769.1 PAS domain-containing sensor histidine kinase [Vibrio sp. 10N.286.48.B7]
MNLSSHDAADLNEPSSSHLDSLESQVERYQQVIEAMPAGVILLDTQGVVREANPEAHRILELPLVGQKWFHLIQVVFDPKEDDGHEVSLRNGRKVRLAISASSTGQLILITDLTETRLLQSRVSDLQRLSSLGRMVASLAHQVRTPLSSAMLYASNLGAPNLNDATRSRFQIKLVDRLHDLEKQVNDMLLFAKGGDNKVVQPFSLKDLVGEYQPMVETTLKSNHIDYFIEVEQDHVELLGNANAIASALSNLVLNAVQISGKEAQVDVFFRPVNNELKISVQDNGPGVPKELQQSIMEPFFTTRSQGTGLGLAVVQMVCRAHNGRLELISEVGEGACFTMCLPLAEQPASDATQQGQE